jgi:hypothetical protein
MSLRPFAAFARIVALVASVVLLTSRTMLLLHEFVGHGAAAMLFGGRITGWYLFLFAGGRVSYETEVLGAGPRLVISLGGIALEILIGATALAVARRLRTRPIAAFCFLCVGTVLVGHGAVYLARGVHYGYGDGAFLAQLLGETRVVVVLLASALAVGTGLYAGRRLAALPGAVFAGPAGRAATMALLAFVCAGIVHGALAYSEIRWFPDPRWVAIMENASVLSARAELARRIEEARRQGEAVPAPEEQKRTLETLERERRPWPLDPVLAIGMLASLAIGVVRGAREKHDKGNMAPPSWRAIGSIAGALGVMVVVIVVLRQSAPP